jgi:hypothetical protein
VSWQITYLGDELQTVDGAGLFQHQTSATVEEAVAKRLWGQEDWRVVAPDGSEWPPAAATPAVAPASKSVSRHHTSRRRRDRSSEPPSAVVAFGLALVLGFLVIVGLAAVFLR